MSKYNIHLGIDYGTSASKLIFRDFDAPGGEKAYVIDDQEGNYRISSSVAFSKKKGVFYFGKTEDTLGEPLDEIEWYHSVKMRVAEEIKGSGKKYFYGIKNPLPGNMQSSDIAILTVWYLAIMARKRILDFYHRPNPDELAMSMTMGIPMSFFNDPKLREAFLKIALSAFWLFKHCDISDKDCISQDKAETLAQLAKSKIKQEIKLDDSVRDWIRTEAESALFWAYSSPSVSSGLYAKIDVGAGTTNASIFKITEDFNENTRRWEKNRMAFFGAASEAVGMDTIDDSLTVCYGDKLRGKEEHFFKIEPRALEYVAETFSKIYDVYGNAFSIAYSKQRDVTVWRTFGVFVFGGGSLVSAIKERLREHPYVNSAHWPAEWRYLQLRRLDVPDDLESIRREKIMEKDLPFLLVAYGLSNNRYSVAEVLTPNQIEEIPRLNQSFRVINYEEWYTE